MRTPRRLLAALALSGTLLAGGLAPARLAQAQAPRLSYNARLSIHAISWAAHRWAVDYYWLARVATCESGLDPNATNPYSGTMGLFQFEPGTYWSWARLIGERRSPYNAYAAANVAAFMFSRGQWIQWSCR